MYALEGKVAVVTGASGGIGGAIAVAFRKRGAEVMTADLHDADLTCDVRDEEQINETIARTVKRYGRVDVVVANAGVSGPVAPLHEVSFEEWRALQSVNLDGVFLTLKAGAQQMAAQGSGSLLAVASIMGLRPGPLGGPYSAAKAGVISMVRSFALELRPAGVRANAICPGFIDTALFRVNADKLQAGLGVPDLGAVVAQLQGRMGTAEDVAGLACYLASDRAGFTTGGAYTVDGGISGVLT